MVILSFILDPSQDVPQACQLSNAIGIGHNFSKVSLFQVYNSIHSLDISCLSETFLDSNIQLDRPDLLMNDYTLDLDNYSNNVKRGKVCIYYKSCPPLRVLIISRLSECLLLEIILSGKSVISSAIYRSPSQSTNQFNNFLSKFEDNSFSIISKKPYLT